MFNARRLQQPENACVQEKSIVACERLIGGFRNEIINTGFACRIHLWSTLAETLAEANSVFAVDSAQGSGLIYLDLLSWFQSR